jgi:hypothetical protein
VIFLQDSGLKAITSVSLSWILAQSAAGALGRWTPLQEGGDAGGLNSHI